MKSGQPSVSLSALKKKIEELGYHLPQPPRPVAAYLPAIRQDGQIFVSGQLPFQSGKLMMTGAMTPEADIEAARQAMAYCFLNGLAAAVALCGADKVRGVLRLGAYVASESSFTDQHLVANGASELAVLLFTESGQHVRSAVGVPSLPLNSTVELDMIFTC